MIETQTIPDDLSDGVGSLYGTTYYQAPMEDITSPRQYASGSSTRIEDMPAFRWRSPIASVPPQLSSLEFQSPSYQGYDEEAGVVIEERTPCEEHVRYEVDGTRVALSMASEESVVSFDRSSAEYSELLDEKFTLAVHLVIPPNTVSSRELQALISRLYQSESDFASSHPPSLNTLSSGSHGSAPHTGFPLTEPIPCPNPAAHELAEEVVSFTPVAPERRDVSSISRTELNMSVRERGTLQHLQTEQVQGEHDQMLESLSDVLSYAAQGEPIASMKQSASTLHSMFRGNLRWNAAYKSHNHAKPHGMSSATSRLYSDMWKDFATDPPQRYMRISTDQWPSTPVDIFRENCITCKDVLKAIRQYLTEDETTNAAGFNIASTGSSSVTRIEIPRFLRLVQEEKTYFGWMTPVYTGTLAMPLLYHLSFTEKVGKTAKRD